MSSRASNPAPWSLQQLPIFVYGTLRKGEPNYSLLRGHTFLEKSAHVDSMDLYELNGLPVAVPGTNRLFGEVMRIAPKMYTVVLATVDALEKHYPEKTVCGTYERITVQATLADGRVVACWHYIWHGAIYPGCQPIPSGNWIEYQQEKIKKARKWNRAEHHD